MAELKLNITPKQFKTVLVGVDESEQGYNALANAIHQAREDDAQLIIASILEMSDLSAISALHLDVIKEKRAEIEENLAKYKAYAEEQGVNQVETVFADSVKAGEALVEDIAPQVKADLIVVGAHSREGFWGSIGSQASYIARNAKISVLIVQN